MPSVSTPDRIMFEIYRQSPTGSFSVVYFTELEDHNRELEISKALRGVHVFDGYLKREIREEGKRAIGRVLEILNSGTHLPADAIRSELASYID